MALSSNEWAAEIAKRVGQRVAHYRAQVPGEKTKRGITAQALADRCTSLGMTMDRTVIAKLEKGARQTITVGELIVLARALGVPPVVLLFDIGGSESTEILPGREADTWAALAWFTGEAGELPGVPGSALEEGTEAVRLFRRHERLVAEWSDSNRQLQRLFVTTPNSPEANIVRLASQSLQSLGDALREVRGQMRRRGLTPPRLQAELAYVDAADADIVYAPLPEESDE